MNAGDTFLVPGLDDHLWIVISDPSINPQHVVIVCLVSWQEHYDQSCILDAGEHDFIRHRTCVSFRTARIEPDATLERLRVDGRMRVRDATSAELLQKVRDAVEASDIPSGAYAILRDQGFAGQ